MIYNDRFKVGEREISIHSPTYFIADIASNHDGDLSRAIELIHLAKDAGADAIKFQHFLAKNIVSDYGFKELGLQLSHQKKWTKSVYEVYEQYELDRTWNESLYQTCNDVGIEFMTTPYDFAALEQIDSLVNCYKIGSGDITWLEYIRKIASKDKPIILSTGASDIADVKNAVDSLLKFNPNVALLQCNTNYTGSLENFSFINLRVLESFKLHYPNMVLGLSDHTPNHSVVLGAIAMGARIIEKHFTDNNDRHGPDHSFSMIPTTWREMVERSRELEMALGDGVKRVEANEQETVVVQRRCLRLCQDLPKNSILKAEDLEVLRPAAPGSLPPDSLESVIGKCLKTDKVKGDALYAGDIAC
jgi:sialic acid synthase SpsE